MSISWTRRSYEAAVLLIPLDPRARAVLGECGEEALDGIRIADEELLAAQDEALINVEAFTTVATGSPGEHGAASSRLEVAVHNADIVVVLTHDLAAVDVAAVTRIGDAARSNGRLLGAVVVSPDLRWHDDAAHRAAFALREAADNVAVLSGMSLALAFFQVLRGGAREEALTGAAS